MAGVYGLNRKNLLLEAAIKLFVEQGFDNTPTSQISKEAGVATGTLFHYFPKKEDLINHAFLYASKKSIQHIQQEKEKDYKKYLKKFWITGMEYAFEHQYYIQFMIKFSNSVYVSKLTIQSAERILSPFYDYMAVVLESDLVRNLPQVVLIEIYTEIFGVFFNYLLSQGKLDPELIAEGFEVVWNALTIQ